jgi:hypothetical protein
MLAPGAEQDEDGGHDDPGIVLEGGLTGIEFDAHDVPLEDGDDDSESLG